MEQIQLNFKTLKIKKKKLKIKKKEMENTKSHAESNTESNNVNYGDNIVTYTWCECGENHHGNQQIGEIANPGEGFMREDLIAAKTFAEEKYGCETEMFNLKKLGLVDDERWAFYSEKKIRIEEELQFLRSTWVQPNTDRAQRINCLLGNPISREYSLADLLARPRVEHGPLMTAYSGDIDSSDSAVEKVQTAIEAQSTQQAEIQIKYQGYIDRQEEDIERLKKQENTKLPVDFDYQRMQGLSNELKQKLLEAKPENIGRASRIPGITPAAISLLLIYLKKHRATNRKAG